MTAVRAGAGRVRYAPKDITAEGIEADLELTDLDKFITKPGTLRVGELRTGQLVLQEIKGEFAFAGANAWRVDKIVSVKELIAGLVEEFNRCAAANSVSLPATS